MKKHFSLIRGLNSHYSDRINRQMHEQELEKGAEYVDCVREQPKTEKEIKKEQKLARRKAKKQGKANE